jgi:fumarate reductase subunit C
MSRASHPHAMQPRKPGSTRTAPPQMPPKFPMQGRYRSYTLFDWTGLIYLLLGFLALRVVWALGDGQEAWDYVMAQFQSPVYIAFHVLCLVSVLYVGVRFFSLFPKAQPPSIGPLKPPPAPAIKAMLYAVWIGITLALSLILSGVIF